MNICFTPIKNSLLVLFLFAVLSGTHTAYAAAPTISSIFPLSGTYQTEVTIIGTGFSPTAANNVVFFGTIAVKPVDDPNHSSTRMTVFPPKGFANERITVVVNGLSATSNQYFLYTSEYNCALTQHSFATNVDFSAGSLPYYIISGDIDGDGKTDLAVSDLLDATISIYQNTASGNTINASSFTTSTLSCGVPIVTIALNDLDGDNKPELLVATNSTSHVLIYRNISTPGAIKFAATPDVTGSTKSASKIALADLDLDGKTDLITTNTTSPFVSLLRNISTPGSIAFDAVYDISVSVIPTGITTGDLNRDDKPEIIVSTNGSTNIKIILNNGSSGGFNNLSFEVSTFLATTASITSDVELADIDADGLLDIVVSNSGTNASSRSITVLKNTLPQGTKGTPPPVFVKAGDYAVPDDISNIAVADFNGDGKPDIAASIKSTTSQTINSAAIYLNTLTTSGTIDAESFATPISFPVGNSPNGLTIADFNNDGKADISTVNPDGNISVLKREAQAIPTGAIGINDNKAQATTCPSTEIPLNIGLIGKSPWTVKYEVRPDDSNSPAYTETLTNIISINEGYDFNVSSEKSLTYILTYISDAQKCETFELATNKSTRLIIIPTPSIKPTTIPNSVLGSVYNQTLTFDDLNATPLSWSVSSGLPTGLIFSNHVISGTPTIRNTYSFTVTAAFATCDSKRQYNVLMSDNSTTWNGTRWSNGIPVSTKDAIIDGNYNTAVNGPINCFHLAVNEGDTLFIKGKNAFSALGNAINNGAMHKDCSAEYSISGTFAGNPVKIIQPKMMPTFLPSGLINFAYNQPLQVSIGESPTYTLTNKLPTGLSLTNGVIQGTPSKLGVYNFSISSTEYNGACEASGNFTIIVETADPNLKFASNGITKITGTAPFTYVPTSQSSGTITYSISPSGTDACASFDASGKINITCGGPIKQYTITAIQAADFIYKADTATTILTIEKMKPELNFLKTGYVLGTTGNTIQYITNSTGAVSIFQINNSNIATVTTAGAVTPIAAGNFDILLKIAETPVSQALDTLITMGIYSTYVPPVAVSVNVVLEMGQDTIINILNGAQGITGSINASLTDIDTENSGVQYKFFVPQIGNFIVDNNGNVSIIPFPAFVGNTQIGFIITDENGTTSNIYFIGVTVNPPYVIPDLKANEIMTPNNDGINDSFVIGYTDITKANALTILDETGTTVYHTTNYQNDWVGTTNKGNVLEPGVYFYAFDEKYSGRTLNGYIQIVK